jgi:hypothetical protein
LLISRPESRLALVVVPTNEELMIAQHTVALLRSKPRKPKPTKYLEGTAALPED